MDFKRVRGKGYNMAQVDAFLHDASARWNHHDTPLTESSVRKIHFQDQKGGYCKHEVNLSLKHIEYSISQLNKHNSAKIIGRAKFDEHIYDQINALFNTLRGKKSNFERGTKGEKAYSLAQVDKFLLKIQKKLLVKRVSAESINIKHEIFDLRAGHKGYSARAVDDFLDQLTTYTNALRA